MPYSPPRWLDRLAGLLLPPASAEHALGDLVETSRSNAEYGRQLASILPRVVWSQVRRRATFGGVSFNAVLSLVALRVALGVPMGAFFATPAPWRLAVPWLCWVVGCALAAAYGNPGRPRHWSRPMFFGWVVAALASAIVFDIPVLRVAGGLAASYLLVLALAMPWLSAAQLAPLSIDTLADHARLFQRSIWWRNARESLAAVAVVSVNTNDLWQSGDPIVRAGHGLFIAGALFIMAFLHLRAGSRTVPPVLDGAALLDFHKRELARQRDILRAVPIWYLLPLVPGFIVSAAGKWGTSTGNPVVALPVVAVLFGFVWWLNAMGAKWLDRKLAEVDSIGR
jgi:hypothetical protein